MKKYVDICNERFASRGLKPLYILTDMSHCRQGVVAITYPSRAEKVYNQRLFKYYPVLEFCTRCFENLHIMPEGRWEGVLDGSYKILQVKENWDIKTVWHRQFYCD